jgi:hypothetical protein
MKEKDFSMKQGCKKLILQIYNCSLMDVEKKLLQQIDKPPKLAKNQPKKCVEISRG